MLMQVKAAWTTAKSDVKYFFKHLVFTKDEHDPGYRYKKFPYDEKPHIDVWINNWLEYPRLIIPKSRQILATWTFAVLYLWDAISHRNRRIFFQSKKESDAGAILDRAKFVLDYMGGKHSGLFKQVIPAYKYTTSKGDWKLRFPELQSEIWAIPEGDDIIRSYTLSGWLCDEMAFQKNIEQAMKAAMPALIGGGRFTGLSSSNGKEYFYGMKNDLV